LSDTIMAARLTKRHSILLKRRAVWERKLVPALQKWFKLLREEYMIGLTKDVAGDIVNWGGFETKGVELLRPLLLQIAVDGALVGAKDLRLDLETWDVINSEMLAAIDKYCTWLIREVTNETKQAVRDAIKAGMAEGEALGTIVTRLKETVGLTQRGMTAVENFRGWLLDKHPELTPTQFESKVRTYTHTLHRRRLETIVRTETAHAQNIGYAQLLEQQDIAKVEFSPYPGCCDLCAVLEGKQYSPEEAGDVIPVHPNCRCCLLPVV